MSGGMVIGQAPQRTPGFQPSHSAAVATIHHAGASSPLRRGGGASHLDRTCFASSCAGIRSPRRMLRPRGRDLILSCSTDVVCWTPLRPVWARSGQCLAMERFPSGQRRPPENPVRRPWTTASDESTQLPIIQRFSEPDARSPERAIHPRPQATANPPRHWLPWPPQARGSDFKPMCQGQLSDLSYRR